MHGIERKAGNNDVMKGFDCSGGWSRGKLLLNYTLRMWIALRHLTDNNMYNKSREMKFVLYFVRQPLTLSFIGFVCVYVCMFACGCNLIQLSG